MISRFPERFSRPLSSANARSISVDHEYWRRGSTASIMGNEPGKCPGMRGLIAWLRGSTVPALIKFITRIILQSAINRARRWGECGGTRGKKCWEFRETTVEEGAEGSLNNFWIAAARDRC
jgi:hypothetical protein